MAKTKSEAVPKNDPVGSAEYEEFTITRGFQKAKDVFRIGAYGGNGAGKTHFIGTCPEVLYLNYDQSERTLQSAFQSKSDIMVVSYAFGENTTEGMDAIIRMLSEKKGPFKSWYPKTIAVDSLTALGLHLQNELIRAGYTGSSQADKGALTIPDYGRILNRISAFVSKLKSLGTHLVLTATLEWKEDKVTRDMMFFPNMMGQKLAPHILDMMDYNILFKTIPAEKRYAAVFKFSETCPWVRSRGKVKQDILESPTFESFVKNVS